MKELINRCSMDHEIYKSMTLEEENDSDFKAVQAIVNVFTDKKYEGDRLKVLQGFRLIFSKCVPTLEHKLFHGLSIEALFDVIASVDKGSPFGNESGFEYVTLLLRLINYDQKLHHKVREELARYIKILLKEHKILPHLLVRNIWYVFKKNSIIWPDLVEDIVPSSISFIENEVFTWANTFGAGHDTLGIKYFAEASAKCVGLFPKITLILNKILCLTQGSENILNLISYFVNLVSEYCDEDEKTIVRLYPREYYQLISFLVLPPEIYFGTKSNILKTKVLELILNKFKDDQSMVLMMLTHYPKWLGEFFVYLSTNNKDDQK